MEWKIIYSELMQNCSDILKGNPSNNRSKEYILQTVNKNHKRDDMVGVMEYRGEIDIYLKYNKR